MKVIGVDNFDRDWIADTLYADNVTEKQGKEIAERLNTQGGAGASRFFRVVPDTYRLYDGEDC